jgi:ATP-binding cassette, subfamily B, bacterial
MSEQLIQEDEYRSRLDLGLWRKILARARPYQKQLVGLAVSGVLVAAVDAVLPRVTGLIIDAATQGRDRADLLRFCAEYFGLVVFMSVVIWYFIVLAGRVATGLAYDMRRAAFARLQELSFSFYDRRPVGWLMTRLTSDCSRPADLIPWFMLDLFWGTSLILGVTVMMLLLNRDLAGYVLLLAPPLALISVVFQQKLLQSQRLVRKTNSQITAGFHEAIMGVRTSKSLVREEENLAEFQVLTSSMYHNSVRNALQSAVYLPLVLTMGSVGVGLALWRGGLQVGPGLSLGTLVAFMQYASFFYIPIQELAERITDLQAAQAAAERLQGLLDTEPAIRDSPEVRSGTDQDPLVQERIREVEFDHVSFAYKEGVPVLSDFSLRVRAGETIALVGPTGSGKSTVVSLLCRFYEPTSGAIRVNGIDYTRLGLLRLQSRLGIVLQTPHLFSGSVRENIRYGRLRASDGEVEEAAALVNADGFIRLLEKGYETEVGEGGGRLSTGQKQLISLARAVLAVPEIFILDEATSSVDTETERLIQGGIEQMLRGRISFIIAHRLSTVRRADRILVVDHGRLVEEGSHEELLHRRGRYARLYRNQFQREREEEVLAAADA